MLGSGHYQGNITTLIFLILESLITAQEGLPQISFCPHPGFACKHIICNIFSEMLKAQKRLQTAIQILFFRFRHARKCIPSCWWHLRESKWQLKIITITLMHHFTQCKVTFLMYLYTAFIRIMEIYVSQCLLNACCVQQCHIEKLAF